MQKSTKVIIAVVVAGGLITSGIVVGYALSGPTSPSGLSSTSCTSSTVVNVVAAENFWGSLVSQIGGTHVRVTSIVSDPNTDPHEYQANASDAIGITNAQYVIVNNVGYDDWATGIIAADGDSGQTILNVGDSLGVYVTGGIVTGNPHLWYNPTYVNETVAWMYHNLTTIAPCLTGYFTDQYDNLTASLGSLYSRGHPDQSALRGHGGSLHGEHLRVSGQRDGPRPGLSYGVHGGRRGRERPPRPECGAVPESTREREH